MVQRISRRVMADARFEDGADEAPLVPEVPWGPEDLPRAVGAGAGCGVSAITEMAYDRKRRPLLPCW